MAHLKSEHSPLMNLSVRVYSLAATCARAHGHNSLPYLDHGRQKKSQAEDEETSPEAPCGPRVLPLQLESTTVPLGVPLAKLVLPAGSVVLPRTLEHRSPPLLHDGRRGLGRKPLLLLLRLLMWISLPQQNTLRQRVPGNGNNLSRGQALKCLAPGEETRVELH
ncbi:hypothetical protein Taro_048737 [Colocasia esculenta]|uniref:Uncharacterized protein n=1 Tax=Colocasia esculenta TaxID=4460 RepID=A0A843X8X0_COLES|nr:hypothetical protein [Colocasia esculenta]